MSESGEAGRDEARELVADALDRGGTFLDGGCGDGTLMESVVRWAGKRGLRIEPYGVDADPGRAAAARERLPQWADRIWTGDLLDWEPPRRFDTVRVGLEHAPPARREELVGRLLTSVVAPGGTLLIGPYPEDVEAHDTVETVRGWGHPVRRMLEAAHPGSAVVGRLLVLPAPAPPAAVTSLDEHRRRRGR